MTVPILSPFDHSAIRLTTGLSTLPPLQWAMCLSAFFLSTPSRERNASLALAKFVVDMSAQRLRTKGNVSDTKTRVIRPSSDSQANSIGKNGPSRNHLPRTGNSRGSHTSEPQPRQAISLRSSSFFFFFGVWSPTTTSPAFPLHSRPKLPPLHTHRNPRPTPPLDMRLQIRMVLNHLKKLPHLTPMRKHIVRKNRTPTQVNATSVLIPLLSAATPKTQKSQHTRWLFSYSEPLP